jgi:alkanesulfonate monooxygenase SsuD/methylene tetrahydromethanopterin reductase-like flavin-dependent oxidoreductase (luciferase family)
VSYGTFDLMAKATRHYREQSARYGWEPGPDDIIYRANMILGETDAAAEDALARRDRQAAFPVRAGLRDALLAADARNVAGERRPANVGGVLPISFCGGPDRVVEQIRRCREEIGAGVLDLSLQDPGVGDTGAMMGALELFGRKVLPRIREI